MLSRYLSKAPTTAKLFTQISMRNFSLAKIAAPAPAFSGMAFSNGGFNKVSLEDYKGKYVVLFFYPLDFTFVCPTEICAFNDMAGEYRKNNCELIACSIDSHFTHQAYSQRPRAEGGLGPMDIPMLSDLDKQISKDYGVLHDMGISFRGTFIIDGAGNLRHSSINDLPVGRSPEETLRLVTAFQHVEEHGEVCPANWNKGAKAMDPNHDSDKTKSYWKNELAK